MGGWGAGDRCSCCMFFDNYESMIGWLVVGCSYLNSQEWEFDSDDYNV